MSKSYKLIVLSAVCLFLTLPNLKAQQMGVSFSYFLPRNGYFSVPISPFSIRGIGVDVNRYFALETGGTLYRMSGLNVKELPFESREALLGPMFTVMVPVEGVIQLVGEVAEFRIKGGVFGFINFATKLNEGNMDRAIREYENWEVANSDLTFRNKPGWGYQFGAELIYFVNSQFGITIGGTYYIGDARLDLEGSYTGGVNGNIETVTADFTDSRVDFTGLEISLGAIFSGR